MHTANEPVAGVSASTQETGGDRDGGASAAAPGMGDLSRVAMRARHRTTTRRAPDTVRQIRDHSRTCIVATELIRISRGTVFGKILTPDGNTSSSHVTCELTAKAVRGCGISTAMVALRHVG
jgi:hypothetical protein